MLNFPSVRNNCLVMLLAVVLHSCFTGIESTPKITYKEVRKQLIASPEHDFAMKFRTDSFATWLPGRLFLLADAKGCMTYLPPPGKIGTLAEGDTLIYTGVRAVPSILGGEDTELIFTKLHEHTDTFVYRSDLSRADLLSRGNLPLPFLVDLTQVARADKLLSGMELYTRSNRWYAGDNKEVIGRKFLRIKVENVVPANEIYPYLINFHSAEGTDERGGMLMAPTVEDGVPSLRGFENIFLLENPRVNYPHITDSRWELIRRGKVELGMTTQEVQLSLGSPAEVDKRPDQSVLYERWGYPGGIYLIFEDGLLTKTNL